MARGDTYSDKRSWDDTPEPEAAVSGNVDPGRAIPGTTFVIHQHHARRLHFDLRLEMRNGDTPVLVSWAVPKNLPDKKGPPHLAVHVEDHPFEYGSFSGTIPQGNYGAGEVRIFDSGTYEVLEQEEGKLSFRLRGNRLRGVYHLHRTKPSRAKGPATTRDTGDKDEWLVFLRSDELEPAEPPPPLEPMLSTSWPAAFDDEHYLFEPKWDGVRALAVCSGSTALVSRNKRDITATYPELALLHQQLVARGAVLDGEIVTLSGGVPSFERLQSRINLQNSHDIERARKTMPVTFIAFDLLYLDGRSTTSEPLQERKALLADLVVESERVRVSSPCVAGEGIALSEAIGQWSLEGIVAKKLGSPYRPGKRTRDWLKIKVVHDADVVVAGWSRGEGSRSDVFGSLLAGAYDGDRLRFVGAVGTGFDRRSLDDLQARLRELATARCPFGDDCADLRPGPFGKALRDPHWVRPELVAKVEFRELTSVGRMRAPSFKGLRFDKSPSECLFSDLAGANAH